MNYIERAAVEADAGRLWRAREILQGALRAHADDVELLLAYGTLLDRLGDRVEAGKYLFLSGRRGEDYDEAISIFLARHGKGSLGNVVAQFPRGARRRLRDLPKVVLDDLEALGLPASRPVRRELGLTVPPTEPWWDRFIAVTATGCFAIILLSIPIGLATMVYLLFRLF